MKKLLKPLVIWLNTLFWAKEEDQSTTETWSKKTFINAGHKVFAYDTKTLNWATVDTTDRSQARWYGSNFVSILMRPGVRYVTALNLPNAKKRMKTT